MLQLVSFALAAPVDDAQVALAARGPHTAVYHKRSTGEPVLEITYRSEREAILRAFSPQGTFVVAVDAHSVYTRADPETCGRLDARAIFEQARFAGLELEAYGGPPGSRLFYRIAEDGQVEIGSSFAHEPGTPIFSWHSDFTDSDVTVKTTELHWEATSPITTWTVTRVDGVLRSMVVGDDRLELAEVTDPKPGTAESVCPKTTAPLFEQVLESQLRLMAGVGPQAKLAEAWPTLSPEQRTLARERQTDWWRRYFQAELPGWLPELEDGEWRQTLLTALGDQEQFAAFAKELKKKERKAAIEQWRQNWFHAFARQIVEAHSSEVQAALLAPLAEAGIVFDPEVQQAMLTEPLQHALIAELEQPLTIMLSPVLTKGVAELTPP